MVSSFQKVQRQDNPPQNRCFAPLDFAALQDPPPPDHDHHHHIIHSSGAQNTPRTSRATLAASAASTSRCRCSADCQQRHSHSKAAHARHTAHARSNKQSTGRTSVARLAICQPQVTSHTVTAHRESSRPSKMGSPSRSPLVRSCPPLQACPGNAPTVLVFCHRI